MNEQMRARVVNILRSEPCRKIAFDLEGTVIAGASFLWAAHYVAAGKVGVEVAPQKKGAAASYDTDANKLSFLDPNFGMSTSDQALVVHECVHLWIDSQKKWTSVIRNEMCAYLAGEMFLEAQSMNNQPDSPSIDQAARIVAKRALAARTSTSIRRSPTFQSLPRDRHEPALCRHRRRELQLWRERYRVGGLVK